MEGDTSFNSSVEVRERETGNEGNSIEESKSVRTKREYSSETNVTRVDLLSPIRRVQCRNWRNRFRETEHSIVYGFKVANTITT